jgi:hypothetical protein
MRTSTDSWHHNLKTLTHIRGIGYKEDNKYRVLLLEEAG